MAREVTYGRQDDRPPKALGLVSSHLGWYDKLSHRWVIYKNRHLFLMVLEVGSPRSRCLQGEVMAKAFLLVQSHCLAVSRLMEGGRGSLQSLFYEVLSHPLEDGILMTSSSSQSPSF